MVQAALTTVGSAAGSALLNQSRKPRVEKPDPVSALPAIAMAPDTKTRNVLRKEADKERLYNFITQPEVLGLAMTIAGIYASQRIKFSDNLITNESIQATATTASILIGLGHAGVGDLTTGIVAGVGGMASLTDAWTAGAQGIVEEIGDVGQKITRPAREIKASALAVLQAVNPVNAVLSALKGLF